ncbi:MAG: substrate-binding domain-containing protein [Candidatus Nanopelagicaceae bacterium]
MRSTPNARPETGSRPRKKSFVALSLTVGIAVTTSLLVAPTVVANAASGTSASAGLIQATATVKKFRKPPVWKGPSATVKVSGLKGKRVVYINVSSGIPVLKYWSDHITSLAFKYGGVKVEVVDAKGSVDEANKGFAMAIATKADAVLLQAFPASLFQKQIADAHAAGIKVITGNTGVPGDVSGGQDAEVSFDYALVGRLIADWFIMDSKGKGKALLVSSNDVPASPTQANATLAEVKKLCPGCDIEVKDVQIPQWETSIPTLFQSTINTQPDRTYLLPIYDGQSLPGLGAIRTAGAGGKVKVGTFNATPGIVQSLNDPKSGLKLDVGGNNEWWSYAGTDTIFRVLSGTAPIKNYNVGLRIFDTTNSNLIKGDDDGPWYGYTGFRGRFTALWKK